MESRSAQITVALIGAFGAIAAAWVASGRPGTGGGGGGGVSVTVPTVPTAPSGSPEVFLNRDSGPGGTTVVVSGKGFASGERVVLQFHTDQVGSTTASQSGSFSQVSVTIPGSYSVFAPHQFDIVATGDSSVRSARAPFTITG